MKKLMMLLAFVFIVPLCVYGTAEKSKLDTLKIGDISGASSTTVRVPVRLTNTFPVSAISFRVGYDPSVLTLVKVDTEGTRVAGVYNRTAKAEGKDKHWVFWLGLNFEDPHNNYVSPGSGPIAYLVFKVSKAMGPKKEYPIRFEQDIEAGHYNALSTQDGRLVFPILEDGSLKGTSRRFGVQDVTGESPLPGNYFLGECSPNPFDNETRISYACPRSERGPAHITLRVWDSCGRLVRTLVDTEKSVGWWVVKWDAQSSSGQSVPAGVYFCRMEADGDIVGIRKLILIR